MRFGLIKILAIVGILVLLFNNSSWSAPVRADATPPKEGKVSSLLSLHIKQKENQAGEAQQGRLKLLGVDSASSAETTAVSSERVYLHFAQEPTAAQIADLSSLGVTVYPDSWIPPVNNFPSGFVLAEMPVDKLDQLSAKSYILSLDTAEQQLSLQNDQARAAMKVDPVWSGGDTGAGVTVAVLDSGLDTTNPDFPTPVAAKDYSRYPIIGNNVANKVNGHGTHVTGSLLGRGVNSQTFRGVAPGASLVFLKTGNDTDGSTTSAVLTYAIRDAVDIYHARIINISYGNWSEYHDGTDQVCQAVDYATSRGATVFCAAGNEGSMNWHYSAVSSYGNQVGAIITVGQGASSYLPLNLVWNSGSNTQNNFTIQYRGTEHQLLTSITGVQSVSSSGVMSIQCELNSPVTSGTYYLLIQNTSPNDQMIHLYYMGGMPAVAFYAISDPNYTIDSPAEADSAIAVGAYVTRSSWTNYKGSIYSYNPTETIGSVASFSSRGPRIDAGAPNKPDLVAPGSAIISVRDPLYSLGNPSFDPAIIDNDGLNLSGSGPANYIAMEGTSMACPMAAGAGALLLSKNNTLTPLQIAQALKATAITVGTSDNHGELINVNAAISYSSTLQSYCDTTHSKICQEFTDPATQRTVFLYGTGYLRSHKYRIIYFDGHGSQVVNDIVASSDTGKFFSLHEFSNENQIAGIWHVLISEPQFRYSGVYSSDYTGYFTSFTFSVQNSVLLPPVIGKLAFSSNNYSDYRQNQIWEVKSDSTGNRQITSDSTGDWDPEWSPDGGKIAFLQETTGSGADIFCMDTDGLNLERLTNLNANISSIKWSPDGNKIAFVRSLWDDFIWVMNADGSSMRSLALGTSPTWSPDGKNIMYCAHINGYNYLSLMDSYGNNQNKIFQTPFYGDDLAWSPDGTKVAYLLSTTTFGFYCPQVFIMDSDYNNIRQITDLPFWKSSISWSPDGNRIAFQSLYTNSGPNNELFVVNCDGSCLSQITNDPMNANYPCWQPGKPIVETNDATNALGISVCLNGNLTHTGTASQVAVSFEWGTDVNYSCGTLDGIPSNLSSPSRFWAPISGLTPGIIYHYRAKAVGDGTAYGDDITFTLSAPMLSFMTATQTTIAGSASGVITVQTQNAIGTSVNINDNTTINLTSSSASGIFDTSVSGHFDGSITQINIPRGSNQVNFYYKDTTAGTYLIKATSSGYSGATQRETVVAAAATRIRVETAADGSGTILPAQHVTAAHSITGYTVTRDQYGNFVDNSTATWSLAGKTLSVANSDLAVSADGKSALFTAHLIGTCNIHITSGSLISVDSGLITAVAGDANGDGEINMADVTKVERIILKLDLTTPGADANMDGEVNMGDVIKIERVILLLDP